MKEKIEILDLDYDDQTLHGFVMNSNDEDLQFDISQKRFFSFLQAHDLLNWEVNYPDGGGNHVQKTGVYSWGEYSAIYSRVKKDVALYIEHSIMDADVSDLKSAMKYVK
jgi:hypothetical protein